MKQFKLGIGLHGIVKKHRWIRTSESQRQPGDAYYFKWKCRRCDTTTSFRRKKPKSPEFGDCAEAIIRQVMDS